MQLTIAIIAIAMKLVAVSSAPTFPSNNPTDSVSASLTISVEDVPVVGSIIAPVIKDVGNIFDMRTSVSESEPVIQTAIGTVDGVITDLPIVGSTLKPIVGSLGGIIPRAPQLDGLGGLGGIGGVIGTGEGIVGTGEGLIGDIPIVGPIVEPIAGQLGGMTNDI